MPALSRLAGRRFRPRLVPTLATLFFLPLLIGLGLWQIHRAQYKEHLQAAFAARVKQPPVALASLDPTAPGTRYRPVRVSGHYDSAHQLLLDSQFDGDRLGYHVYTPLQLTEPNRVILVNRGWVPRGENRAVLPKLTVPAGPVTLTGLLAQPNNPGIHLGDSLEEPGWPKIVPYIDYGALDQALGIRLVPAVVLLEPGMPGGYARDWKPTFGGFGPMRHLGYALQWFALAIVLVVLYISLNLRPAESSG